MATEEHYLADAQAIIQHRHDNGADFWATADGRIMKGSPFTTLNSVLLLLELGMEPGEPILQDAASLIFNAWQKDGRFKIAPKGGIYPCHTIHGVNTLCHMGYGEDPRVQTTLKHLLEIQYQDGGWRCKKISFGHGPETEFSNPGPTLTALDAFRHTPYLNKEPALDRAVEFLLEHWVVRKPLGPCHYGMGTLFMQPEYPLGGYNIFTYLYILSFYNVAKKDKRFLEGLDYLTARLVDGQIVVERVNAKLAKFTFCEKGKPSALATKRYAKLLENINRDFG